MKKEDGDCRMQGCGRQGQQYGFDMTLRKAGIIDCEELYRMQLKCFRELLEKYRDYDFSPGAEKIEKTERRLREQFSDYYFICLGKAHIGALRVIHLETLCILKQIYILPEYQGKGYAQRALRLAEALYPSALDVYKRQGDAPGGPGRQGYADRGRMLRRDAGRSAEICVAGRKRAEHGIPVRAYGSGF